MCDVPVRRVCCVLYMLHALGDRSVIVCYHFHAQQRVPLRDAANLPSAFVVALLSASDRLRHPVCAAKKRITSGVIH